MKSIPSRVLILAFLAALGLLVFHGLFALHQPTEFNPTLHVASRYMDMGPQETGENVSFLAVLLDYRGFYLTLLVLLNLVVALTALLFCVMESFSIRSSEKFFYSAAWFFSLAILVWGALSLWNGSNWMDYEFLSGPAGRAQSAWVSGLLGLGSILFSFAAVRSVWRRGKEQYLDRK